MSTGLECEFIEFKPDTWYYVLQDGSCPVQCWDWREFATAYGPFTSYERANQHLRDNHANPGGHSILEHKPEYRKDPVYARLVSEAQDPKPRPYSWERPRYY
jgi:hypothetical protein